MPCHIASGPRGRLFLYELWDKCGDEGAHLRQALWWRAHPPGSATWVMVRTDDTRPGYTDRAYATTVGGENAATPTDIA